MRQSLASDALRWIALGRDVLVLGDEGSGRSTALKQLRRLAESSGTNVLHLSAFRSPSSPLAALLAHPTICASTSDGRSGFSELVRVVVEELGAHRNLLVIDDIDLLDDASLSVVEEVLRRTSCRLAASLARSILDDPANPALPVLAQRAPAELRTSALGEWEMVQLLAERLQGPPGLALTSATLTRSGGNPAVALALIDAARWARAVELREGVWALRASLDSVPHDAVVNVLTRRLGREQLAALQMLAWTGPVASDDALALVGAATLAQLSVLHRVATVTTREGDRTGVAPPALAHGLLTQLSAEQIRDIAARAAQRCANLADNHRSRESTEPNGGGSQPQEAHWPTVTSAFVLDRLASRQAQRRAAWVAEPTVSHANALLDVLGVGNTPLIREVFRVTVKGPDDDVNAVSRFIDTLHRWIGASGDHIDADAVAERLRHDPRLYSTWRADAEWMAQVSTAITNGEPHAALTLLDSHEPHRGGSVSCVQHLVARCDALLFAGNAQDATRAAQKALTEAVGELDKHAIQMHAASLAMLHIVSGNRASAWEPVALALRLGPPGPFEDSHVLRSLACGAILQARSGNTRFGRQVLDEVQQRESRPSPILQSLTAWAGAELHYAEGDDESADSLLWETGLRAAQAGQMTAALLSWAPRAGVYTPEQIELISGHFSPDRLPLFGGIVRLHQALARGTSEEIISLLAGLDTALGPTQRRVALDLVNDRRRTEGRPPLDRADLPGAADHLTHLEPALHGRSPTDTSLSDRERQVALFARSGMSNREIASRLFLSVRTVESHMYRALRKLGLSGRAGLLTDWEPGADPFTPH